VRDLGDTVILGGWVRLTGTDNGKPFEQKARFADVWHKGQKGWQLTYTQVTLADHP
jgi:ketosteroid isomerase-like protein